MFEELKSILTRFAHQENRDNDSAQNENPYPSEPATQKKETIVICNQKGGCGKTTTAINLSAYLAKKGNRVLIIDLDTQAHASLGLGVDVDNLDQTIYDVLIHDVDMEKVIVPTCMENLFIAPANHFLSGAQLQLANLLARESILKIKLNRLYAQQHFDYCIIDTSPTLNLITLNGLVAANKVLIPIQTHYFSLEGMKELFFTIDSVKERLNPQLKIVGILATLFDQRIKANCEMMEELNEFFGDKMLKTVIHYTSKLIEAPRFRLPVALFAPDSMGAFYYSSLADELERLGLKGESNGELR